MANLPPSLLPIRTKISATPPKPLTAITAYNYASALLTASCRLSDGRENSGPEMDAIDVVFVMADEVARCSLGQEGGLTLEEMIIHAKGAVRGVAAGAARVNASNPDSPPQPPPIVVAQLPRGTYEVSPEQALSSALELLHAIPTLTGVLLVGGKEMTPQISKLAAAGIFTVAHMGVPTVSAKLHTVLAVDGSTSLSTSPAVGRTVDSARELLTDAQALDRAGVSMVLLEGTAGVAAERIAGVLGAPVLGIGCGNKGLAGQMVWMTEVLTMTPESGRSRWQKCFSDISETALKGIRIYAKEVGAGNFPGKENVCDMETGEDVQFRKVLAVSNRKQSFSMQA